MRESQNIETFPPIVAIVGPTAVGKSRLALELAPEFQADIVSADSRQVYRYMDIGTDKPSLEVRAHVRHHMLDLVAPADTYSVQRYSLEGTAVLHRIAAEGRMAFVVGGTGFYVRGLLDRMRLPEVPPNPELRHRLRQEAEAAGPEALHRRLKEADAPSAERIHPTNLPRLVRALEIVETTGSPVPATENFSIPALFIGLRMERDELRRVAAERIDRQIAAGLAEETRLLLEMGYSPNLPALDGFAYRQMIAYLAGRMTLDEAAADYRAATYRYIRRQMTWFRADKRIHWLDARPEAASAARRLITNHVSSL